MKLRHRLTLGFALTAMVPALLVAALHSYTSLRSSEATAEAHVQRLVQGTAHAIDEVLQNVARDMDGFVIADDPHTRSPRELTQHLMAYSYAYPYFRELMWVGARGAVLASSNPSHHGRALTDVHEELADDFALVLRQPAGRLHVSDFDDTGPALRNEIAAGRVRPDMLSIQLLLRADDARGHFAGVLVATVTTQVFLTVLEDLQSSIAGASPVVLLNRRGEILLSSDPQAPLLRPHELAARLAAELDATDRPLVQFEFELDGEDQEVTIAQIPGLGPDRLAAWRVVAMQPEDFIRGPARRAMLQTLALLAAIIAVSGYLGLRLARAQVQPIEQLAGVVRRIGAGDIGARADIHSSNDEIEHLAQTFNTMATSLERERQMVERTNQSLEISNRTLDERNRRNQLLTEMIGLLQTVRDLDEAAQVLPRFLEPLFAPNTGALYIIKSSLNYLDVLVRWGETPLVSTFEITDCWGLRRGQPYLAEQTDGALVCSHVGANTAAHATLCVPMMAEGVTLGLLHLAYPQPAPDAATAQAWRVNAQRVAEQLGLALANLKLRKQLHEQSVHDIQTGLYNRRFLEESLPRELARAERENYRVAVFMLDVDHFKKFNDSYGHEAGDAVLRALGRVIIESARASDLAYRFGGEEFTVALPRISPQQAREWADRFMQRVRGMEVKVGGLSLPRITVSMGLAFAPEHGTDPETVIQAADLALYEAKRAGRDRLVVYTTTAPGKTADQGTP